ncbi:MAG: hypothetical protein AB8I08_19200 [Sandaracinaceae bacterium]
MLVVGTTDPLPAVEREGLVIRYGEDGTIRWAERIGEARSEQLSGVAENGETAIIGGVTRSFGGAGFVRDEVLLVEATADGVGRAWRWGTATDDNFLWAVIPGGEVGAWVGLGFHAIGDDRDGLVAVFDETLQPVWAAAFDAGDRGEFFSGVVVGDTVYAAEATGEPGAGATRAWVVALTETEVRWARESAQLGSTEVSATVAPTGEISVAGSIGPGRAADMRFSADGAVSGTEYGGLGSRLTRVIFAEDRTILVGGQFDAPNFRIRMAVGTSSLEVDTDIWTRGFLRTPMVELDSGRRLIAERTTTGFIDIPFSATPEAGCTSAGTMPGSLPIDEDAMPTLTVTREELTFTGEEITLPSTDVTPTLVPGVCE